MPPGLNIKDFIDSLEKQYQPRAHAAVADAIYTFGLFILDETKVITPIEKGNLVASGSAIESGEGSSLNVTIGFNTQYAVFVHEVLTAFHKPPTRSKFLSVTMQENAPKFLPWVKARLDKEFAA